MQANQRLIDRLITSVSKLLSEADKEWRLNGTSADLANQLKETKLIVERFEQEQRNPKVWISQNGTVTPIDRMSDEHLLNVLALLERRLEEIQSNYDRFYFVLNADEILREYFQKYELTRIKELMDEGDRRHLISDEN